MTFDVYPGRELRRRLLAAACLVFPFAIYAFAFWYVGTRLLFPPEVSAETLGLAFAPNTPASLAKDLAARETYLIAAALMLIIAVAALAYAIATVAASRGTQIAIPQTLFAAAIGAITVYFEGNPIRTVVVEAPLDAAAVYGAEGMRQGMRLLTTVTTFFAIAAVAALMIRFADLAWGPEPADIDDETMGARGRALRETLTVGSLILTSATVATFFYYHYPLALMTEASAESFRTISAIGALHWGAVYAALLGAIALPGLAAQVADRREAEASGDMAPAPQAGWFGLEGWSEKAKAFGALLTVLAPAAAGPLIEALGPALGFLK